MTFTRPTISAFLALALSACQCGTAVSGAEGELRLEPAELNFGERFAGTSTAREVSVINEGRAAQPAVLSVEGPFAIDERELTFPAGATALPIRFEPLSPGIHTGTLTITRSGREVLSVALRGEGKPIPECAASTCHASRFELSEGVCVSELLPDGTACSSACLGAGSCVAGECLATTAATCDDGNPCTLDGCASDGSCVHAPRECPVADPCTASWCDPVSGCATTPLEDGTACGEQSCRQAKICVAGACVTRTRPNAEDECTPIDLAAASSATCALMRSGAVRCWGDGFTNGYQNLFARPAALPFGGPASRLDMASAACVSLVAGGFQCFYPYSGQVWVGADAGVLSATNNYLGACWLLASGGVECSSANLPGGTRPFDSGIRDLAASAQSYLAVRDDGGVVCWGARCQLAPPDGGSRFTMVDIALDAPALAVRGGRLVGCATHVDGVSCFQAGKPTVRLPPEVVDVALRYGTSAFSFIGLIADGGTSRCVAVSDGGFECSPYVDGGLPPIARAAAGNSHECFLTHAGEIACVGDNQRGQLGDQSPAPPGAHRAGVAGVVRSEVTFGLSGAESVVVVLNDGGVAGWGSGNATPRLFPLSGVNALDLMGMPGGACLLRPNGTIECADGTRVFSPTLPPIARVVGRHAVDRYQGQLTGEFTVLSVSGETCTFAAAGSSSACDRRPVAVQRVELQENHSTRCLLLEDAGVECEGSNQAGRLGTGNRMELFQRVPVGGLGPVRKLAMSQGSVCALEQTGRIQCWGAAYGAQVVPPTPVPTLLPFARDLACGFEHCCALVGENAVSCWGRNLYNQLGREGGPSGVPLSVPMPDRVEHLSAGRDTTCAQLRNGQLWCWGSNSVGQLGFAPLLSSTEPVWVTQ